MSKSSSSVFLIKFYERSTDFTSQIIGAIRSNLKEESKQDIEYISRLASPEEVLENLYHASYTFVYKVGDDIVGFATMDSHNCIKNLYVFSKYRRNGYGRDIVHYIMSIGNKKYQAKCFAKIRTTNIPSKQLFQSMNFNLDETVSNVHTYSKNIVKHNPKYYVGMAIVTMQKAVKKVLGKIISE
jgi:predicted acetyltransferase